MAAVLPDINTINQQFQGIREKCGFSTIASPLRDAIRHQLRILDEQNAVNRYVWYGLPYGLTSQMIERVVYYRYSPTLFYREETNKAYCLPYVLEGSIDFLGRAQEGRPLPFLGTNEEPSKNKEEKRKDNLRLASLYFPEIVLKFAWDPVVDGISTPEEQMELFERGGVIFYDYTPQYSQKAAARAELSAPILSLMAEIIPYCRTALMNATGIQGLRIQDQSAAADIYSAAADREAAALNGRPWVPILSTIELQDLGPGSTMRAEEFLLTLQALDNYRLSLLGLNNGGLFQKKAHMLEAEQRMNDGNSGIILQDGLINRQHAADVFNSIWGTSIYVEISETITGVDRNMDAEMDNNTDEFMEGGSDNDTDSSADE